MLFAEIMKSEMLSGWDGGTFILDGFTKIDKKQIFW